MLCDLLLHKLSEFMVLIPSRALNQFAIARLQSGIFFAYCFGTHVVLLASFIYFIHFIGSSFFSIGLWCVYWHFMISVCDAVHNLSSGHMRCVNDKSMNNKIKNITQECTEIRSRTMLELAGSVCECVNACDF